MLASLLLQPPYSNSFINKESTHSAADFNNNTSSSSSSSSSSSYGLFTKKPLSAKAQAGLLRQERVALVTLTLMRGDDDDEKPRTDKHSKSTKKNGDSCRDSMGGGAHTIKNIYVGLPFIHGFIRSRSTSSIPAVT